MRIFTRYILREVVSYALIGGVLFTFVLFMRDLGKVLDLVVRDSASLADVLRIFAYTLPNTLTFTIPTAVLAGILLGLSRLSADSEITAMRACGIGALSFVRIVSILSFTALAFGLVNALYFVPRAASNLLRLEDQLKSSQASFEVQPRVFYEDFHNYVLYVQDVRTSAGASSWRHVFLADLSQPTNPNVINADSAIVSSTGSGESQGIDLHLINAGKHELSPTNPNQYDITSFISTDLLLQLDTQDDTHISRVNTPLQALSLRELWQRTSGIGPAGQHLSTAEARAARIEANIRLAYPFACLVLMLIGVPLGISTNRGGKSTGFILTLLLVFAYYLLSELGVGFAKSGKLSPLLGVWGANILFAAFGSLLLQQLAGGGLILTFFSAIGATLAKLLNRIVPTRIVEAFTSLLNPSPEPPAPTLVPLTNIAIPPGPNELAAAPSARAHRSLHPSPTLFPRIRSIFKTSFPLLLDEYVLRSYATNFLLSLAAFALLILVFAFFELIGDIVRNRTPLVTVGAYLLNLIPYVINTVTPLCSLLAVLVTFGSLNRTSELTAMKATGISLYRVVAPILVLAALLAAALFAFDESYLPDANRRQEQLRAEIKGKPTQTFLRPDQQWISGQTGKPSDPTRIFYYQFFDRDRDVFANLSIFEFDPQTFTLQRRIFAQSVTWDPTVSSWIFENGWQRTFGVQTVYTPFTVTTFPEIREQPDYFNKEERLYDEMSFAELSAYIDHLRQSGTIDTVRLSVQLQRKIAEPVITLVMAVLAVPFALSMGRRGGLAGIATAIGVAIVYWVVALVFGSMGNVATLPPLLAAWSPDLLFGIAGAYLLLRTPT
jgi:LPS export ABC transporter permease LptG/LPS export ABC transporter permease LptF